MLRGLFGSSSSVGPVGGSPLFVVLIAGFWFDVLSSWVPVGECLLEVLSPSLPGLLTRSRRLGLLCGLEFSVLVGIPWSCDLLLSLVHVWFVVIVVIISVITGIVIVFIVCFCYVVFLCLNS